MEDMQVAEHSPPSRSSPPSSPVEQTVLLVPVVQLPAQARVSSRGRIVRPPERPKDAINT